MAGKTRCVNCGQFGHENCCIGCGKPIGTECAQRVCSAKCRTKARSNYFVGDIDAGGVTITPKEDSWDGQH